MLFLNVIQMFFVVSHAFVDDGELELQEPLPATPSFPISLRLDMLEPEMDLSFSGMQRFLGNL